MSIIQAEVEVDETNIPNVQLGQAAKITIDAIPTGRSRPRREIGNSPIQTTSAGPTQATNFKVVVIPVKGPRRPAGLHVHGGHQDGDAPGRDLRADSVGGVRELIYEANGQIYRDPQALKRRRRSFFGGSTNSSSNSSGSSNSSEQSYQSLPDLKPGQTRKEVEGVFVVRDKDKRVEFVPIKMGIAGDKFFEVLSGVKAGDEVVTGPYNSVRNITDGDP
jgi:HlyD family secretion protein